MGAELLILCLVRGKFLNDGHFVRCGLFYYCGCKELYNFLFENGVVYMKGAYCYVRKGQIYSFVDPIRKVVCFLVNGRKFIGLVPVMSKDIKAIRTFQCNMLKLLNQVWKYRRIEPTWKRRPYWMGEYDYYIQDNVAYIYRCGNLIAEFNIYTDDTLLLEYFLESVMSELERFMHPKKNNK